MPTLAIFGRHPQLELGFNGAMSYYEALAFLEQGWDVTLLLPTSQASDPVAALARKGFRSFSELDLGDRIAIRPITPETTFDTPFDVLIWQTYNQHDEPYWKAMRAAARVTTKSQPRLFTGELKRDTGAGVGTSKRFDLVALALRDDYGYARRNGFFGRPRSGFAYVPRGVSPDLLNPSGKTAAPSIGFDRAIDPADGGAAAVAHIVELVGRLRQQWPELQVYQVGTTAHVEGAKLVSYRPMKDFYDAFINKIWVYVSFDFRHSIHAKTMVTHPSGRRVGLGLYENQMIEAQMSGALLAAGLMDTPAELFAPQWGSLRYPDHDHADAIHKVVRTGLQNFHALSPKARDFALANHTYSRMGQIWNDALRRLL
jgi:hypothetical protein